MNFLVTLFRIFLRTVFSARSSSLVSGRSVGRVMPSLANNDFSSAVSMSCTYYTVSILQLDTNE